MFELVNLTGVRVALTPCLIPGSTLLLLEEEGTMRSRHSYTHKVIPLNRGTEGQPFRCCVHSDRLKTHLCRLHLLAAWQDYTSDQRR